MTKSTTTAQIYANQINKLNWQRQQGKISAEEYKASVERIVVAEQAATTATRTLTSAFKLVGNILFSLAIDWLITKIQEVSKAEEEARQNAESASRSFLNEAEALKSLRKEYNNIISSNDDESKKNEQLIEWKKKLVEQYGFEEDAINRVTKARETGFEAIDKEIYENAKKQISELGDEYDKAVKAMESAYSGTFQNSIFDPHENRYTQTEVEALKNFNISTKMQYGTSTGYTATLSYGEDLVTSIENISNAINYFRGLTRDLSDSEKRLLGDLQSDYNRLTGIQKDYETQYSAGMQAYAQKAFYEFTHDAQNLQNSIENVTAETYEVWKENLLALAGNSEPLKELLLSFVNDYFPQFADGVKEAAEKTGSYSISTKQKLDDLTSSLDGVYESFDTAFSNQSTIQSAFDKIQSGTSLTAAEMRSLIKLCKKEFPEIGSLFTKTEKGYTISAENLIKANDAIMQSTKDTVEEQIKGYQEVISQYDNIKNISGIPESDRNALLKKLGVSEEEYKNAKQQIENLKRALDTLGISLESNTDRLEEYNKVLKSISANLATGVSAQKEMNESGKISASTLESLLSLGEDYIKCITIENGIIKFNAEEYKKLEKAKIDDKIATIELTEAEIIYNRNQAAMYGNSSRVAELNALLADEQAKRKLLESLRDNYDTDWTTALTDKTSKSDDPIKDAFQKRQKELEHLLNMEQITEAEYYKQLFDSKEYKALLADRTKYADELNSIDEKFYKFQQDKYKEDADKQFDDLEDQRKRGIITAEQYAQALHDLGQELYGKDSIYGGTEFAIKALEELDKKVKETPDDIYDESLDSLKKSNDGTLKSEEKFIEDWIALNDDTWKAINPKQWKENYNEIADYTQDFYKDLLDKGALNPDQYKDKVQSFFYRLKSMGIDLGKNWLADALEIDDIEYDKLKESLSADGDRTLDDVLADAEKLSEKNIKLFSDDPETLRKNAEDIFKSVSESAKDALDKMLITPDEYLQIIDKWGDNLNISKGILEEAKELSESDYLDRWDLDNGYDENKSKDDYDIRAKRIEYIYELAEQLYGKNGQKNLKAYNALINQGLEDVESLVEDYYDAEIKKLEKINDEEEKRQKALELQLNLIKARQKLEEAKSQRNQLILENGVFRYDYDQEVVMSAQEDIAEAEKAILEQEREDQKEALENQKEETLKFFDSVGGKLDDFIDRVEKFLAGDKDAFKVNESKTDVKTNVEVENDNNSSDIKDKNIVSKITDISDVTKDTFNIAKTLADNFSFENLVRALGGNPTAEAVKNFKDSYNATLVGKQITPSTLPSNVTNNSSTTNNSAKTVNIGDIHLHLDLTVESLEDFVENKLEQFAQEVGDAFETEILRKMTSN